MMCTNTNLYAKIVCWLSTERNLCCVVVFTCKESSLSAAAIVFEAGDCFGAPTRVGCDDIPYDTENTGNGVDATFCVGRDNILCVTGLAGSGVGASSCISRDK